MRKKKKKKINKQIKYCLKEAKKQQYEMSVKSSAILQKIGIGFITVLWSFFLAKGFPLNNQEKFSFLLVSLYFLCDFLQYYIVSLYYNNTYNKLNKNNNCESYKKKTYTISKISISFFIGKAIMLFLAIILFLISIYSQNIVKF